MSLSRMADLVARVVLGGVFCWSSVPKILHPGRFYLDTLAYGLTGPHLTTAVALFLPWLELALGLALLSAVLHRGAYLLSACLLIGFAGLQAYALGRGLEIDCGCFGAAGAAPHPISMWSVGRDLALLAVTLCGWWALRCSGHRPTTPPATGGPQAAQTPVDA